jgi:hypothetical protein
MELKRPHFIIVLILIVIGLVFLAVYIQEISRGERIAEGIINKLQTQEKLTTSELEFVSQILEKEESGEELNEYEVNVLEETSGGPTTACFTGTKWCCNSESDCDGLASEGDVYICNEIWNWELIETCGEDETCYDGECRGDCGECPQYHPPSDDFCENGTIIPPVQDECGCFGPLQCNSS